MADISSLAQRIAAEFTNAKQKVSELQEQWTREFQGKRQRLEQFERALDDLRGVWRPRLEELAKQFADRVNVIPTVEAGRRMATFQFQSELARIVLRFSVLTDEDVRNVVFQSDLEIIPILMKFDSHSELRLPLENIDREALATWIEERVLRFVQTYLELHQNNYYLKDFLVEDPIAKVRFPKYAAGAKLDWKGTTIYFLGDETRQQFELEHAGAGK